MTDIRVLYKDEKFVTRRIIINIQDEMFSVESIAQDTNYPKPALYYTNKTEPFAGGYSRKQTATKERDQHDLYKRIFKKNAKRVARFWDKR